MKILEIQNLSVEYYRNKKVINALTNVSVDIFSGETISIVGESGCGKSTLALSILGLIPPEDGKITSGKILFNNNNLLLSSDAEKRNLRGKEISIIFQDPFSSLNPVLTVGDQLTEALSAHRNDLNFSSQKTLCMEMLSKVMFTGPERIFNSYPHQLSGGQRQRIMIAMAVMNDPKIIIADEPTTALDVTIQKEILDLLDKLKKEFSITLILITHNLPLAFERSNRIAVIYGGQIVELDTKDNIFKNPQHSYTRSLISSVPRLKV